MIFIISHPIPVIYCLGKKGHEDLDTVLGVAQMVFFPLIRIDFRLSPSRNFLLSSTDDF